MKNQTIEEQLRRIEENYNQVSPKKKEQADYLISVVIRELELFEDVEVENEK